MNLLYLDEISRIKISRVREYAEENHYYALVDDVPGNNENYVCFLGRNRCVFTFTHLNGRVCRHLTISVPSDKYPNPAAAFMIATEFGFTGWDSKSIDKLPKGWAGNVNKNEHCLVLIQDITGEIKND
jgi:hypothetical protein